ncbi:MAG: sigma 54-interacting transcriptional regulator, partial [Candidatus Methylophosphatis roskildensis]
KELVARGIHNEGERTGKPLVPINCGGIPETLLESELFGYKKGAFTGADRNKKGLFQEADGGTIFLDEIGELPLALQVKLLRVLQESEVRPVGDAKATRVDVRVIAATGKHLDEEVRQGRFREDLYYRLNVVTIYLPPLRERREDIPALAFHFVKSFGDELGKGVNEISEGAMNLLMSYDWPGNVRELENALHRATILATDHVLRKAHLLAIIEARPDLARDVPRTGEELKRMKKSAREQSVEGIERLFVLEALKRNAWNVTQSAADTGMLRPNFQALMKKHDIRLREGDSANGETGPPGDTDA